MTRPGLVPAQSIDTMATNGAGFTGLAAWLDMTPPTQMSWQCLTPRACFNGPGSRMWPGLPADLDGIDGEPIAQTPRLVLKQVLGQATE